MGATYAHGLRQWRRHLRDEKRVLVDSIEVL
jgi:hypothetical protein